MDQYLPVDNRAEITLNLLIQPVTEAVLKANNIKEVTQALGKHLPQQIAHQTELKIKMLRNKTFNDGYKMQVDAQIKREILNHVCENLPFIKDEEDRKVYYYMREDIINWYDKLNEKSQEFFKKPEQELISITLSLGNQSKSSTMSLSEDQLIGIVYAIKSQLDSDIKVTLKSSLTNTEIDIDKISEHALIYKVPIELATEHLKRPYHIDVVKVGTLYFVNPEFMQGILSVAQWYKLPNNGKDVMWSNLYKFTKEGLDPLTFTY